jgi:hypothetical protein
LRVSEKQEIEIHKPESSLKSSNENISVSEKEDHSSN